MSSQVCYVVKVEDNFVESKAWYDNNMLDLTLIQQHYACSNTKSKQSLCKY
jgi:hypothetical protein